MENTKAESLLAIEVGEIHTRAALFDVVNGAYRFLAMGVAPTTATAPYADIREGVRLALDQLAEVSGRRLIGENEQLIVPERLDGSGVDRVVATLSAGQPVRIAVVGLLEEVSVESAIHLAETTYARVVEVLSLNDRRKMEERLGALLRAEPDLILIAGGTDGGASRAVMRMVEIVALACQLMQRVTRPHVLYVGNQALVEKVTNALELVAIPHIAPNIRPFIESEWQLPAQQVLADLVRTTRLEQIRGSTELNAWTKEHLYPAASAFERIIRFLSKIYDPTRGVLGIDVGASATTVALASGGEATLRVYPRLGLGSHPSGLLEHIRLSEIGGWLPFAVSENALNDHLHNKALYPASIPITAEELAIEQAVTRQVIRAATRLTPGCYSDGSSPSRSGFLRWFEPILATGSALINSPSWGHTALTLLDALQPVGITTLVVDQYHLASMLGAAASLNPTLVVQVLESGAFLNLGTVVSPVSSARPGTPILRLRAQRETGEPMEMEVRQGTLEVFRLPLGQPVRLHLQPLHRADIGMGAPGRGGTLQVVGGALGVMIDARGRPLRLPQDAQRRNELYQKWLKALGG
jgi:hypothetical protein